MESLETVQVKPTFDHTERIMCPLPLLVTTDDENLLNYGFEISVSNNGVTFSNGRNLTVYDSKCVECSGNFDCKQKVRDLLVLI